MLYPAGSTTTERMIIPSDSKTQKFDYISLKRYTIGTKN